MKVIDDASNRCIEDPVVIKQIRSAGPTRLHEAQSRIPQVRGGTRKPGATGWVAAEAI